MKRTIKKSTDRIKGFIAVFLIIAMLVPVNVFAAQINPTESPSPSPTPSAESYDDSALWNRIYELQDQINEQEEESSGADPIPKKPVVMVVDPLLVEIEAGQTKTVELSIKNLASDGAKNVITTVSAPLGEGLTASFEGNDGFLSSLGNKATRKVKLKITADRSSSDGYKTLSFKHNFLNSLNAEGTSDSAISVRVINPGLSTTVVLRDIAASSENIVPGEDFTLSAVVANDGTSTISDIAVALEGVESEGIYIKNATNVVSYNTMGPGGSQTLSMPLSTNKDMKRGSYPLTLKLSYYDADSETKQQSKTYTYYVNVSGASESTDKSEVVVTNITAPASSVGVSEEFSMTVTLQNKSGFEAKNVKLTAKPEGEGAVVPKSTSIAQFLSVPAGETREASFTFAATTLSKSQNYVIGFTLDYENGEETEEGVQEVVSFTQYQGVNVINPEADKKEETEEEEEKQTVPKIIIKEYEANPIIVRAGEEFDLSMTFLNTSSVMPVKNVKVILTVEEGTEKKGSVFTPVNSSNTFYIDSIGTKGEASQQIRMYTVPDASPKNYIINVKFEYEDTENNPHESLEAVGINVKQITELNTSEFVVDEFASLYQPIYINFELYNTGKVTLSNLMIKIEGNFETTQKSMYYGSFTPSSTEYYDNQITPIKEGLQEGAIVITYEDDTGEKIEERKEFTVEVSPEVPMDEGMMGMPPEGMENMVFNEETGQWEEMKPGLSLPVIAGISIGAVAIVIAAVVIIRKRKKKREEMEFDE